MMTIEQENLQSSIDQSIFFLTFNQEKNDAPGETPSRAAGSRLLAADNPRIWQSESR